MHIDGGLIMWELSRAGTTKRLVFGACSSATQRNAKFDSVYKGAEVLGSNMTLEDQPDLPPIDLNSQEDAGGETDTDDESDESVDGFDFHSSEDEIEEFMVEHYIREQDSDDIQREHAELQQQYAAMVADDEARNAELEEMRQAVKRKLEEREEWTRIKRLRVSVEMAYEAMGVAVPLVEGGVAVDSTGDGGVTGGAQVSAAEVIAAMENFEEAVSNARRSLDDLTIHQQQMDEN